MVKFSFFIILLTTFNNYSYSIIGNIRTNKAKATINSSSHHNPSIQFKSAAQRQSVTLSNPVVQSTPRPTQQSPTIPITIPNNTTEPWTFLVYASDDSTRTNYTSIYQLLGSLYNAVEEAPDKQVNIIVQTKIPDQSYRSILARNQQIIGLEATVPVPVAQILRTAQGIVRFIITKNNGIANIQKQQWGNFNHNLSDLNMRKDFLNFSYSLNLPGKKMYCLYAHGRGWMELGSDRTMVDAVDFANGLMNQPIDILRLDSCLSQGIETLYEIAIKNPRIPYVVASQQITPLDSAVDTYARLMPVAYRSQSVLDYAKQHVQDRVDNTVYNNAYTRLDTHVVNNGDGITYSLVALNSILELKYRIDVLAYYLLVFARQSQPNKNLVVNMLKETRLRGTLFHDIGTLNSIGDRDTPSSITDRTFYYDLFDIIRIFKEIITSEVRNPEKQELLSICDFVESMYPYVVLENHVSRHDFLQAAKGISIDLSPPDKFNLDPSFDAAYKRLAFSRDQNNYSTWYHLLRLENDVVSSRPTAASTTSKINPLNYSKTVNSRQAIVSTHS